MVERTIVQKYDRLDQINKVIQSLLHVSENDSNKKNFLKLLFFVYFLGFSSFFIYRTVKISQEVSGERDGDGLGNNLRLESSLGLRGH